MIRPVSAVLATAVLACMAASPPRDPVYIPWSIETPILWAAEFVDHGREMIVVSTHTPQASDPLWQDMLAWADNDSVPSTSPLAACFAECKIACLPGTVKRVKFTAGDPPSCDCECYPVPPTTVPPPGNGSAD